MVKRLIELGSDRLIRVLRTLSLAVVCWLLVLTLAGSAYADGIMVNEVLVNEPGSQVLLEWFELSNNSQQPLSLLGDSLFINAQLIAVFGDFVIEPGGYRVLVRHVPSFENLWGDASNFWGDDTLLESYSLGILTFSLRNQAGSLSVSNDTLISTLIWNSAGADGISWERISASGNIAAASVDTLGASPGRVNSVARLTRDWEIVSADVVLGGGLGNRLEVTVRNAGAVMLPAACVVMYDNPSLNTGALYGISGDSLYCEPLPMLDTAASFTVSFPLSFVGVYDTIGITIAGDDERLSNNTRLVTIPGSDFPPLQINEFLANPQSDLRFEWVELKNISAAPVDLTGWRLGDELGFGKVDTSFGAAVMVQPGEYIVLAQLPSTIERFYRLGTLPLALETWRALNNNGDVVRLQDPFGFLADSVSYDMVFKDNVSWSRSEEQGPYGLWGRSQAVGGTPDAPNSTFLNPGAAGLAVSVEPNPFSPDRDGFAETTSIDILAPDGGAMTVTIYDLEGREIRRLFDGVPFSGSLIWDGRTASGQRVIIGIYIIYVEIEGGPSVKKTVVVAR